MAFVEFADKGVRPAQIHVESWFMERIERDRLLNQRQPLAIAVYETEYIRKSSIVLWIIRV